MKKGYLIFAALGVFTALILMWKEVGAQWGGGETGTTISCPACPIDVKFIDVSVMCKVPPDELPSGEFALSCLRPEGLSEFQFDKGVSCDPGDLTDEATFFPKYLSNKRAWALPPGGHIGAVLFVPFSATATAYSDPRTVRIYTVCINTNAPMSEMASLFRTGF